MKAKIETLPDLFLTANRDLYPDSYWILKMKRTQVRLKQNASAFYFKRTCVLSEMYLRFSPNAKTFFLCLFFYWYKKRLMLFLAVFSNSSG